MPNKNQKYQNIQHVPVMLNEVLKCLVPAKGESYLDLTAGMGGHAKSVIDLTKNVGKAVLVDRDSHAIDVLKNRLPGAKIIHSDFLNASEDLCSKGFKFDLILADLGVSSLHFNEASRGFSFSKDGPLDMRMDDSSDLTAEIVVNNWSEEDLADAIRRYGEEPKARKIAHQIVIQRPVKTTAQLAAIILGAIPRYRSKIHPATKTFQALRIVVNDELGQLEKALPVWIKLLNPNGRIAVISFHSLEDRLVKKVFAAHSRDLFEADIKLLNKKPLVPSSAEIAINPRARSAKLRAAAKIKI